MRKGRSLVMALLALWILISLVGCIAVSREVRREVPAGAATVVPDRGQWEFDQEWQCRSSQQFELDQERREFEDAREAWFDLGWELTDVSVVPIPATAELSEQICLVGSYRRWIDIDS